MSHATGLKKDNAGTQLWSRLILPKLVSLTENLNAYEWMSSKRPTRHKTGHFRDESFEAIRSLVHKTFVGNIKCCSLVICCTSSGRLECIKGPDMTAGHSLPCFHLLWCQTSSLAVMWHKSQTAATTTDSSWCGAVDTRWLLWWIDERQTRLHCMFISIWTVITKRRWRFHLQWQPMKHGSIASFLKPSNRQSLTFNWKHFCSVSLYILLTQHSTSTTSYTIHITITIITISVQLCIV